MAFRGKRKTARAIALVTISVVALAGCGGSSSSTPGGDPATATRTPAATETGTPGIDATATPSRTATAAEPTSTEVPTETPFAGPTSTPTPTHPLHTSPSETPAVSPTATATATETRATRTPTPTSASAATGPLVTFIGMVRPDGCRIGCFDGICVCSETPTPIVDDLGREVFLAQGGGRGLLVVEARPGQSGLPVGSILTPDNPADRPDLQLLSSNPLGNGSPVVCDKGAPPPIGMGGGIPAVDPPDFGESQQITDALNDFACRFAVQPSREDACTLDNLGNFEFVRRTTTMQFCDQVSSVAAFPPGDTVLTARLRDVGGNLGPPAQVVIRNPIGAAPAD